jgi:hypothetical protein
MANRLRRPVANRHRYVALPVAGEQGSELLDWPFFMFRDLRESSAAIFAYTGRPPESNALQLLLTQQPRRPNDSEAGLALPGGYWVRLGYDNFAISVCRGGASACGAV